MEPQAALQCLHLYSPDPLQAAHFYNAAYGMAMTPSAGGFLCRGPGRELRLSAGPANQLHYAHYALADAGACAPSGAAGGVNTTRLPSGSFTASDSTKPSCSV